VTNWSGLQAPSLAEMERLAEDAFARLPDSFRRLCEGVVIRVEDFGVLIMLADPHAGS
jgi:predicted Zn-dependent protease with MMP-like domain